MRKPRIYTASKLQHAETWLKLTNEWPEIEFTANWPLNYIAFTWPNNKEPAAAREFWQEDERDLRAADIVMVYAEPDDVLMGGLVEVGMGIALGKPIIVVGENRGYNTWQYHPLCIKVKDLAEAHTRILGAWAKSRYDHTPGTEERTLFEASRHMRNFLLDLDANGLLDPEQGVVESKFQPEGFLTLLPLIGVSLADFTGPIIEEDAA